MYCKKGGHLQLSCFQIVLLRKRGQKKIKLSKTISTFPMTMERWHIHYTMFPVVQHHTKQIST